MESLYRSNLTGEENTCQEDRSTTNVQDVMHQRNTKSAVAK